MYKILKKEMVAPALHLVEIDAPEVARKSEAGHFVILRLHEKGERIPLTIADFNRDKGTITCVFQEAGKSTKELGSLNEGDSIMDFVGPMGTPSQIVKYGWIICTGGGVGVAPIYPIARALKEAGNKITGIIGARNKNLIFWEEKMAGVCNELLVTTDDGSYARKGFVTDVLKDIFEKKGHPDLCIAIGPLPMMSAVCSLTKKYGIKTIVSLNSIMVDGTGMCGSCRVTVAGETRFACVDGPEFDGHQVDFDEMARRSVIYRPQEQLSLELYKKKAAQKCTCTEGGGH